MKKLIHVGISVLLLQCGVAQAGGKYDQEITGMRRQFGAYITQSEKNIAALSKLDSAYARTAEAMGNVVNARRELQGRCPTKSKEALLDCLARQGTAISFLDLYVRQGLEIMPEVLRDTTEAGAILNQDVSAHVKKLQGIADGYKVWNDVTLPALRKQFDADRESLVRLCRLLPSRTSSGASPRSIPIARWPSTRRRTRCRTSIVARQCESSSPLARSRSF